MPTWLQNPLRKFLVFFAGAYLLLLALGSWGGVGSAYKGMVHSFSDRMFGNWWSEGYVFVKDGKDPLNEGMDLAMHLVSRKQFAAAQANKTNVKTITVYQSTWQAGYLITAFFLALVVASPVPTRRKLWSAGIGLVVLTLYVLFRFWINIDYSFQQNPVLDVVHHGEFMQSVMIFLDAFFMKNIVVSFIVPLLLWILITFQKDDREEWVKLIRPQATA
ncbi:MAG: hypothetical protein AAF570_02870 [Bacteroidota bacterium]